MASKKCSSALDALPPLMNIETIPGISMQDAI